MIIKISHAYHFHTNLIVYRYCVYFNIIMRCYFSLISFPFGLVYSASIRILESII
jgi:hypothetical protein